MPSSSDTPLGAEALIRRLHVLIAETKRCVDDDRLLRAQDKLNYMDGVVLPELEAALSRGSADHV
jgi:hypothetical protein